MDVTVMEYLLALAREGSLTKAAEPFFISPSALSQRLAREEKEVSFPLFRRENGRFLPTREGAVYLRYAQEILTVKQETYQQIARLSSRAVSLRIASSPPVFPDGFRGTPSTAAKRVSGCPL